MFSYFVNLSHWWQSTILNKNKPIFRTHSITCGTYRQFTDKFSVQCIQNNCLLLERLSQACFHTLFFFFLAEEVLCPWTCMGVGYLWWMGKWEEMGWWCSQRNDGCWFCESYEQWLLWSFCSWLRRWIPRCVLVLLYVGWFDPCSFIQYSVWRQVQSLLQNDASI